VRLPAGKLRSLLAVLLLNHGRIVTIHELTDRLWGDVVPADPRATVQKYVMRLRRSLADTTALISTEPDGYRIEVAAGQLDLLVFDALVERAAAAAAAGRLQRGLADLDSAVRLWREVPPLGDVRSDGLHRNDTPVLVERYLRAVEMRVDIGLRLGLHAELCDDLLELVSRHPLRERFWAQRMRALYATNRQAEALSAYRTVARLLADELGIDPGPELRTVHQQILAGTPPETAAGRPGPEPRVRQLPMPTAGTVGRIAEIEEIVRTLDPAAGQLAHPLVLVTGPEGIGKTTVAVAAAHRLAGSYPDGQLFAELGERPPKASCVRDLLRYFLRSLGTETSALPEGLDDAVGAFRTITADRRLLVVLDGATDAAAVRTLLPGGERCGVLITGRDDLASLLVSPGGRRIALDVLPVHAALDLLAAVAGEHRVRAERHAATRLVTLCGRSPLAVRTAAAHLAVNPGTSIAAYVDELEAGCAGSPPSMRRRSAWRGGCVSCA
jgi:DNA-binding SARP family transcriptional activator